MEGVLAAAAQSRAVPFPRHDDGGLRLRIVLFRTQFRGVETCASRVPILITARKQRRRLAPTALHEGTRSILRWSTQNPEAGPRRGFVPGAAAAARSCARCARRRARRGASSWAHGTLAHRVCEAFRRSARHTATESSGFRGAPLDRHVRPDPHARVQRPSRRRCPPTCRPAARGCTVWWPSSPRRCSVKPLNLRPEPSAACDRRSKAGWKVGARLDVSSAPGKSVPSDQCGGYGCLGGAAG
jgi:hypothetical protein